MKRYLLIASGLISAFITLEIAVRLFVSPPPSFVIENLGEAPPATSGQLEIFGKVDNDLVYPTITGRRVKPNVKATVKSHYLSKLDVEITTNQEGYRYRQL